MTLSNKEQNLRILPHAWAASSLTHSVICQPLLVSLSLEASSQFCKVLVFVFPPFCSEVESRTPGLDGNLGIISLHLRCEGSGLTDGETEVEETYDLLTVSSTAPLCKAEKQKEPPRNPSPVLSPPRNADWVNTEPPVA